MIGYSLSSWEYFFCVIFLMARKLSICGVFRVQLRFYSAPLEQIGCKGCGKYGYYRIMENRLETTILHWGYIGIMEQKMQTTLVCWG